MFLAEVKVAMLSKNLILQSPEHPLYPEMFLEEHESMRTAPVRVYDDEGAFFGIYEYQAEKEDYKPLKVFK